jgi:heme A synthase
MRFVRRQWKTLRPALIYALSITAIVGLAIDGVVRQVSILLAVTLLASFAALVIRDIVLHARSAKNNGDGK